MGEWNENLVLRSIFVHTHKWHFRCPKILRHGTNGFTPPPKEGVLQICIAFKNPLPRPGLNPRTLGPMAKTNPYTPLRQQPYTTATTNEPLDLGM
jgi:hypothetical protein